MQPLWQVLYDYGAEVVLSGTSTCTSASRRRPRRGGRRRARDPPVHRRHRRAKPLQFGDILPNSEVRNSDTFGVLELTLRPGGYDWRFVPEAGRTFTDPAADRAIDSYATAPPQVKRRPRSNPSPELEPIGFPVGGGGSREERSGDAPASLREHRLGNVTPGSLQLAALGVPQGALVGERNPLNPR